MMNGLFLTCLLVSAGAVCGHRSFAAQVETVSQRLSSVGIEVGKAFTGSDQGQGMRLYSAARFVAPHAEQPFLCRLPLRIETAKGANLRASHSSAPIRGPSA
jgi:hypothetical protein